MTSLLLLIACKGGDVVAPIDTYPDVIVESQPWEETGLDDSADDSAYDSADDTADDTGDVQALALVVNPSDLLLDPGASVPIRGTLQLSSGEWVHVTPSFSSSDAALVTVDADGTLRALAVGSATITAESEGLTAQINVEVQASPALYVTVIDAQTGTPLTGAAVSVGGAEAYTDTTGVASLSVDAADPLDVTVWAADEAFVPASFIGVVARRVVLPLRMRSEEDVAPAELSGAADFSTTLAPDWDERSVGLVGTTLQRNPLLLDAGQLLSPARTIDFFGLDLSIPGNIVVDEVANDWSARAWDGPVGLWALGGPVPIGELTAALTEPSGGIGVLAGHIGGFSYACASGLAASSAAPVTRDLALSLAFDETLIVEVPQLPDGFTGGEQALVLVLDDAGDAGWALAGLGVGGAGELPVLRVAEGGCGWAGTGAPQVLAYAEVGGFGSGEGRVLAMAPVVAGAAIVPDWMAPPAVPDLTAATRIVEVDSDPRAVLVHAYVLAGDGSDRDIWVVGGDLSATIPEVGPNLGLGRSTWSLLAVETRDSTFDSLLIGGGLRSSSLAGEAVTTAGWRQVVSGGSGG